jgi:hypothetical protein
MGPPVVKEFINKEVIMELTVKQRNTPEWYQKGINAAKETLEAYENAIKRLDAGDKVRTVGYAMNHNSIAHCTYCKVFYEPQYKGHLACRFCPMYQKERYISKGKTFKIMKKATRCIDHGTWQALKRWRAYHTDKGLEISALNRKDFRKALVKRAAYHKRIITQLTKQLNNI